MTEPSSKIVSHSVLLLVFAQLANLSNLLFHMATGRMLGPAEYGLLVFMLNMIMIVATPLDALRTALAHYAAALHRVQRSGDVMRLARRWIAELALVAALVAVVGGLCADPLARYFNLPSRAPVLMALGVISLSLFPPIAVGILQGLQAFITMSIAANLWSLVRLVVGVAGVMLIGPRAVVAMGGFALGVLLSALVGGWAVLRLMRGREATLEPIEGPRRYVGLTMLVYAGFALMANVDVILATRYFPEQVGVVAMAGTIARTVVYLPMPIAIALFPKVASAGLSTVADRSILDRALLLSAALVGSALAVCMIWPELPLFILYGVRGAESSLLQLVRVFVGAMSPMPLVFMLASFEMAQRRFVAPLALLPIAGVFMLAVNLLPRSPFALAGALCVATCTSLLCLLLALPRTTKRLPLARGVVLGKIRGML